MKILIVAVNNRFAKAGIDSKTVSESGRKEITKATGICTSKQITLY